MSSVPHHAALPAGAARGPRAARGEPQIQVPCDADCTSLRTAAGRGQTLVYAGREEQLLQQLRNGIRAELLRADEAMPSPGGATESPDDGLHPCWPLRCEAPNVADSVKSDGRRLYLAQTRITAATSCNVLKIVSAEAASAGEELDVLELAGDDSIEPQIYLLQHAGVTEQVAVISQSRQERIARGALRSSHSPRTTLQLLDIRTARRAVQLWQLQLEGELLASRKVENILYVVSRYRPTVAGLTPTAAMGEGRAANERRIRAATLESLLPRCQQDGADEQPLVTIGDCLLAADLQGDESCADLLIITALDLRERRITDVACLGIDVGCLHLSQQSLYVGEVAGGESVDGCSTVIHRFALDRGAISYRASGTVVGAPRGGADAYFMDEYRDALRIMTTRRTRCGGASHHLSVLRETADRRLALFAALPNAEQPQPFGGARVRTVRFAGERIYVVTADDPDRLYAVDIENPADPFIAGSLQLTAPSARLWAFGPPESQLLLTIGQHPRLGVQLELIDASSMSRLCTLGRVVFGAAASSSGLADAADAVRVAAGADATSRYRLAVPLEGVEQHRSGQGRRRRRDVCGVHLLEVRQRPGEESRLELLGVIRTLDGGADVATASRSVLRRRRCILLEEAALVIQGEVVERHALAGFTAGSLMSAYSAARTSR